MLHIKDLIGVPFVERGRGPEGYDCWGLCCEVFRREGIVLPEYSLCCHDTEGFASYFELERARWTKHKPENAPVPSVIAIKFNSHVVNHVGVYIGDGRFLHTREKTGAVIERIRSPIWRHRIEGFYTPCRQL